MQTSRRKRLKMIRGFLIVFTCVLLTSCAHWSYPVRGSCPTEHPIKGNVDSMYYHLPTDTYYYRTWAEFCFESSSIARNHGYKRTPR